MIEGLFPISNPDGKRAVTNAQNKREQVTHLYEFDPRCQDWRGTAFGGTKGRTDLPRLVDRYLAGRIKLDELVTRRLPLAEINTAFDLMHRGEAIRSVVHFGPL